MAVEHRVLGKPRSPEQAREMLRALSGREHHVYTGFTVCRGERVITAHEDTAVRFRTLTGEEIEAYVDTKEPMDKAGAYALQGRAASWVSKLNGSDTSVIGLPLYLVRRLLIRAGFPLLSTHYELKDD